LESGQYKAQKWTGSFFKVNDLKLKSGRYDKRNKKERESWLNFTSDLMMAK